RRNAGNSCRNSATSVRSPVVLILDASIICQRGNPSEKSNDRARAVETTAAWSGAAKRRERAQGACGGGSDLTHLAGNLPARPPRTAGAAGQADDDLRAGAGAGAGSRDAPPVQLDQGFHQGEPDPQAAPSVVALGALAEQVEDPRQQVR